MGVVFSLRTLYAPIRLSLLLAVFFGVSVVLSTLPFCIAGNATAFAVTGSPGVLRCIGVPFPAMGLASVDGGRTIAAPHVFLVADALHVERIDTARVAAQMVQFFFLGNRSDQLFVGESVSSREYRVLPPTADIIVAVATGTTSRGPIPATSLVVDNKLAAESCWKLTQIHLATFATCQQSHRHLDYRYLRDAEPLCQLIDEESALWAQPKTSWLFHRSNVGLNALHDYPFLGEV